VSANPPPMETQATCATDEEFSAEYRNPEK
jgi:hypothetical protein